MKHDFRYLIAIGAGIFSLAASAQSAKPVECPTMDFVGLKPGEGRLMVAAYNSAESFLKAPVWSLMVKAEGDAMRIPLCNVNAAEGAITAFQDLNGNNKFADGKVSHRGRLKRTAKFKSESEAGRFLVPAFRTGTTPQTRVNGPDAVNTANTDVIEHAGRVLALWEGGSAYALVDPQGNLWNFGNAGNTDVSEEFPRLDPRFIGGDARFVVTPASWRLGFTRNGFHGLQVRDVKSGKTSRFDYGDDFTVEEHVVVARPGGSREFDGWIVGTAFDANSQRTCVSVFDAANIGNGPMARAWLPYWLPLGFHGNFTIV